MIRGIVSLLRPADHAIFLTLVIMRGDQRLFFLLLHCAITLIEFTKPTNVRVQYYDDLLSHPSLTSNSSTLINKVSPEASWGGLWTEQKRQIELTKGQAQKWHFGRELRRQQYLRLINYLLKELSSHVEMYDFSLSAAMSCCDIEQLNTRLTHREKKKMRMCTIELILFIKQSDFQRKFLSFTTSYHPLKVKPWLIKQVDTLIVAFNNIYHSRKNENFLHFMYALAKSQWEIYKLQCHNLKEFVFGHLKL